MQLAYCALFAFVVFATTMFHRHLQGPWKQELVAVASRLHTASRSAIKTLPSILHGGRLRVPRGAIQATLGNAFLSVARYFRNVLSW